MLCPKCGGSIVCGCKNCRKYHGVRQDEWVGLGGEIRKCPHCEYSAHIDTWLDHEYDQWKMSEAVNEMIGIK